MYTVSAPNDKLHRFFQMRNKNEVILHRTYDSEHLE